MSNDVIIQLGVLTAIVASGLCGVYVAFRIRAILLQRSSSETKSVDDTVRATEIDGAHPQESANPFPTSGTVTGYIHVNTPALVHRVPPPTQYTWLPKPESGPGNSDYVRLKREFIGEHAEIRFSVLKDWISVNMLAIFRRVTHEWRTAKDLIAIVPSYLEPEAEIFNGEILLIGTRGHAEKLAVPIRYLEPSSDCNQFFDFVSDEKRGANSPAVLVHAEGEFEVVSRGSVTERVLPRIETFPHSNGEFDFENLPEVLTEDDPAVSRMECIIIPGFSMESVQDDRRKRSDVPETPALVGAGDR